MGQVHRLPGTTFSNSQAKGDYAAAEQALLTLPEFERWLALEIARYHDTPHRALDTPPRAAWQAGLGRPAPPRLVMDSPRFVLDFLPVAYRRLRRDGVHLHGLRYWSDTFGLWLGRLTERCAVRFDPRDLSTLWVRLPDGDDLPVPSADLRWPALTWWELRAAQRALRAQGLAAAHPEAVFQAVEAQRAVLDDARAATRRARRFMAKQDEVRRAAASPPPGPARADGPEAVDYDHVPDPFDVEIG